MEPLSRDEVGVVFEFIAADLERIEGVLTEASTAGTPFLTETAAYLTKAGGKRLPPALLAPAARLWSGCGPRAGATAAAIGLTPLATLYHDGVIDEAAPPRGGPTPN